MDTAIDRVLTLLKNVRPRGNGWLASCPVPGHGKRRGDRNPSLHVSVGQDGRVLLHCFAGCSTEDVVRSLGLSMRDLFPQSGRNGKPHSAPGGAHGTNGMKVGKQGGRPNGKRDAIPDTVTIESLATAKKLPADYVRQFAEPAGEGKIRIIYRLPSGGRAARHRIRGGTPTNKRVYWDGPKGVETLPYGLDRLDRARQDGYLILVEGETDCWALWYHGFPALGLPGAKTAGKLQPEYLDRVRRLYIWMEPDRGGTDLVEGVAKRLGEIGWTGQAYVIHVDGVKDPCDLHVQDPTSFRPVLARAMDEAEPLRVSSEGAGATAQAQNAQEPPPPPKVRDILPDAPGPKDLVVPHPYSLTEDGLEIEIKKRGDIVHLKVADAPVIITARLWDSEERIAYLRIAWRRPDGWHTTIVDRGVALDSRRLVGLASEGVPVSSGLARYLAEYLREFETSNWNILPCRRVSSHLGWQGRDGEHGYLWGETLITPAGDMVALPIEDAAALADDRRDHDLTSFRPIAPGDAQIAAGYRSAGTLEGWIRAVAPLADYPRALLAVYASCVPPLLPIIQAPNFVVDFSSRTSTGKTTVLRVAASVWGCPDERGAESAMGTWDATKVWVERASAVLHGLPLILDDTSRAKTPQIVADVLYMVASGRGRGRGNARSLSRVGTWRTVLLSSGESRATSYTADGGTRARTIEIVGMPFGDDGPDTGALVDRINAEVMTHYGHAGPELVRWLLRHREQWPQLRQQYEAAVERYAGHHHAIARRLAHAAAAIAIAAVCLHAALQEAGYPLPWDFRDPLADVWDDIARAAEEAPPEVRALRDVVSWAYANAESFWGRHAGGNDNPRVPPGGWAGRWDADDDWEYIAFYPTVLRRILREGGYEYDAVVQSWRARGWLICEQDRYTWRVRVGPHNERPHMIVIRREAIEAIA